MYIAQLKPGVTAILSQVSTELICSEILNTDFVILEKYRWRGKAWQWKFRGSEKVLTWSLSSGIHELTFSIKWSELNILLYITLKRKKERKKKDQPVNWWYSRSVVLTGNYDH